jgi:hypothetical protein
MPQEFLNGADIMAGLHEVSGKGVAKGVWGDGFSDVGGACGFPDSPLKEAEESGCRGAEEQGRIHFRTLAPLLSKGLIWGRSGDVFVDSQVGGVSNSHRLARYGRNNV